MNDKELTHWGVLGMHWGIRRASGGSSVSTGKTRKRETKESLTKKKAYVDTAKTAATEAKNISTSISKMKNTKNRIDLSKMTDAELKSKIARLTMEQQYNTFNEKSTTRGKEYLDHTLDIVGSTLAIGSTALGLALTIKQLKGA